MKFAPGSVLPQRQKGATCENAVTCHTLMVDRHPARCDHYNHTMAASLLADAFAHHAWATARLIDVLGALTDEQLLTRVPGTYGSAIDTLRHVVSSDAEYLEIVKQSDWPWVDLADASLPELRATAERAAAGWTAFLAGDLDAGQNIHEVDPDDGYQRDAPLSVYLAAALHHGNEHRTQVATILATLGVDAPSLGVWDFGAAESRIAEVYPAG